MKKTKTNVHRLLEKEHVAYAAHEYPWQEDQLDGISAASSAGLELKKVFKTLVTVGDKTGPLVVCIPVEDELNLKALAKESGNKKVYMLPMKELEKTTGYMRGGCSPIGMKKSFPTFIDSSAKQLDTMIISAGKRGFQAELSPEDLQRLTEAVFANIRV